MITFQREKYEIDKPIYVICGSYDKNSCWFPVREGEITKYPLAKAFKGMICEVSISTENPGTAFKIMLWCSGISSGIRLYKDQGYYLGHTAQEARKKAGLM